MMSELSSNHGFQRRSSPCPFGPQLNPDQPTASAAAETVSVMTVSR